LRTPALGAVFWCRLKELELPNPAGGELEELLRRVGGLLLKTLADDQDSLESPGVTSRRSPL
jgi:hypothetical protein